MKIAFRLDANNEIGMGHAVRCFALAQALMERGCQCEYLCRDNAEIRDFAKSLKLGFVPVPVADLNVELAWMRAALEAYDAVVIDSYFVCDAYIGALNRPGFTVSCYDDNALYEYSCDAVINGNLHAAELEFRFGGKQPRMLIGGEYTLLRREFRDVEPVEIRERANRIFVCFGGSDVRNFTPGAVGVLQELPGVEITVVLGAMTACDEAVRAVAGDNVRVIKNPPSMRELMSRCDIAVTACGSTVYELAALGIPSVVVVQADNQELIADFLNKKGLMKSLGDWKSADMRLLQSECALLLADAPRRRRESAALRVAVARDGAARAAANLFEIMVGNRKNVHT